MIVMERSRSVSSIASLLSNDTTAPNTNSSGSVISESSSNTSASMNTSPIEISEEENRNAVLNSKKDDVASHALLMLQDSKVPRSSSSSALNEKTESVMETPFRHWKKRSMPFPSPSSRTPSPPNSDPMSSPYLNSAAQMASVNAINSLNTNFNSNFSIAGVGGSTGSSLATSKRIQFESAGTYGLQRNVPFLLRNSSIWRPGILPTPTTSSATSTRIISTLLPSTSTSTFEYVRLHFPNDICATDEVTRRNRNQKGCPSPITMHPTPSSTASIIDLRVEFKVFVVKDGKRDRDVSNEVKDVFVVREHSSKLIRKGEELQISVRFHRLPSDFISSSREFIFYLSFHRAIKDDKPDALKPKSTTSKTPQDTYISGPMEFDSEIILHSKSRTKPGQSAKEAAAERETIRLAQEREAARQTSSTLPSLMAKSPGGVPTLWNKNIGTPSFSSPSSSPNISPRECSSPRNAGSPPFDPASVVYNLRTSGVGHVQVPNSGDSSYDDGGSKKRLRTLTPLKDSPRDNRSEKEKADSLKLWKVFLEELNFEDSAGIASTLVAEKIEINQLSSLKFEALRSLGFLVGDIIRMIDYSGQFMAKHPEIPRPSPLTQSTESMNQISSQMSSIQLNKSSSNVIPIPIPSSIEPSPSVSPSNTYERFEEDHPRSRSGSLEQNASGKESKLRAPEDEDEDNALQIVDEGEDKEIVACNEERKSAFSVPVVSSPCNLRIHPRAEAIYDAQEALLQLLNSPPRQRNPLSAIGKSPLSFSSSSIPTGREESGDQATGLSPSFQKAVGIRESLRNLPQNEVVSYLKDTIKIVQRFADKMVSKVSNTNNLDQELADRTKEMHNVLRHLESCLTLCAPYSRPFTLDEIETSNRNLGGGGAGTYSSESDSSPLTGRTRAFGNKNTPSDNDTDGDFDLDDDDVSDTEGSQAEANQPLAYYVGVIKAHLELRRVDLGRKSGLKRDVLKKEYVLVPIEEASRVLGISTTKLSRAYKNLSILSKCGWLFKGRRRRLRWPTRPLRVLLKYICDKYLNDLIQNYYNNTSNMMEIEKEKTTTPISRSYSLDQIVHH